VSFVLHSCNVKTQICVTGPHCVKMASNLAPLGTSNLVAIFKSALNRIQFRNSWSVTIMKRYENVSTAIELRIASWNVTLLHKSWRQRFRFDTTERTRGYAEVVGRKVNSADFIRGGDFFEFRL